MFSLADPVFPLPENIFPLGETVGRAGRPLSGNRVSFSGAPWAPGDRGLGASADADAESKFVRVISVLERFFVPGSLEVKTFIRLGVGGTKKNEKSERRKRKPQECKSTKNPRKKRKIHKKTKVPTSADSHEKFTKKTKN